MTNITNKTPDQRKAEKRAEALRANLRRRKELAQQLNNQDQPKEQQGRKNDE
jgi:hypothetical protein